jgi:predicted secreted protein
MLSTWIKMGQRRMSVVVRSGDKAYTATKTVKVTVGGCG